MLSPFKILAAYSDLNKMQAVAKEKAQMNVKVTQWLTLLLSLSGTIGAPALAANWLKAHSLAYVIFVAASILLHAVMPSIFGAPGAAASSAVNGGSSAKLSVAMLCALVTLALLETGCSAATVAKDIVNWTPALQSAVATVDSTASLLAPADAPIFAAATVAFDADSNLVVNQAKAYLANPNQTVLQALQTQMVTFQQQVNASLLQIAGIKDAASQTHALNAVQAVATIVAAMMALVASISTKAQLSRMAADSPIKLAQVQQLLDERQMQRVFEQHYGYSNYDAALMVSRGEARLAAQGF